MCLHRCTQLEHSMDVPRARIHIHHLLEERRYRHAVSGGQRERLLNMLCIAVARALYRECRPSRRGYVGSVTEARQELRALCAPCVGDRGGIGGSIRRYRRQTQLGGELSQRHFGRGRWNTELTGGDDKRSW